MVELLHPVGGEPGMVFERTPGAIEIHELRPREVALVRVDIVAEAFPAAIGEAIGEIEARMAEAGVDVAGPPFTRYLSFCADRIEAEIGCPVWRPAPHAGRVFPGRLPGGRVASVIHVGPYDTIEQTYEHLAGLAGGCRDPRHGSDVGGLLERPGCRAGPGHLEDGDPGPARLTVAPRAGGPPRGRSPPPAAAARLSPRQRQSASYGCSPSMQPARGEAVRARTA